MATSYPPPSLLSPSFLLEQPVPTPSMSSIQQPHHMIRYYKYYRGTCIVWTPWEQPSILIIKMSSLSRSVYVLKNYFGTMTKCEDYAGVLITV